MNRNEIETTFTWDLSSLFKNQNAFDEQFEDAKAQKMCIRDKG